MFFLFVESRVLESLIGSVRPRSPSFFWSFPKKVQPTWWRWASHRLEGVVWKCTTDVPELQFLICEAFKSLLGFPALGKKIYLYLHLLEEWRLVLVYRAFKLQLPSPSFMRGQDLAHCYAIFLCSLDVEIYHSVATLYMRWGGLTALGLAAAVSKAPPFCFDKGIIR